MGKKVLKLHGMEVRRWLVNPWLLISAFFSGLLIVMATLSTDVEGSFLLEGELVCGLYYLGASDKSTLLKYVGLCLCTFFSAGIFAEDYEENALYMRIQRIGVSRYSYIRVLHTFLASWFCAFLGIVFAMLIFAVGFGQPFFPQAGAVNVWIDGGNQLLMEGKYLRYFFYMAGKWGFCASFYGELELLVSTFMTNRKALYILPLLFWYFNQFMLSRIRWIPDGLKPSLVLTDDNILASILGVSDGIVFLYSAGYTLLLAVIVFLVLRYRISRYKAFGRTME